MLLPSKKFTLIGITLLAVIFIHLYKRSDTPQGEKEITRHTEENNNYSESKIHTAATDFYSPTEKTNENPQPPEQPVSSREEIAETISDSDHPDQTTANDDLRVGTALTPEPSDYEGQDSHWAFEKESYYINLFSEEESLSGFVLNEAKCESLQCKLSFLLNDEQQKDDITNKLMERLISQSEDISVSFGSNTPSHEAILYIKNEKPN